MESKKMKKRKLDRQIRKQTGALHHSLFDQINFKNEEQNQTKQNVGDSTCRDINTAK